MGGRYKTHKETEFRAPKSIIALITKSQDTKWSVHNLIVPTSTLSFWTLSSSPLCRTSNTRYWTPRRFANGEGCGIASPAPGEQKGINYWNTPYIFYVVTRGCCGRASTCRVCWKMSDLFDRMMEKGLVTNPITYDIYGKRRRSNVRVLVRMFVDLYFR